MNKFWRVVFSRKIVIFLLLLLQIGVFAALLVAAQIYTGVVYTLMTVISVIAAIRIISSDENPAYKLAWIIPVLVIPIFGAAVYLFYQSQAGVRILKKNAVNAKTAVAPLLPQNEAAITEVEGLSANFAGLCRYMKGFAGFPVYKNDSVLYLPSGEEFFDSFLEDIRSAEKFILIEFFIIDDGYCWDSVLEILKERKAAGVDIKIMYDGMGSQMALPSGYDKKLREMGFECRVFNPVRPLVSTIQNNRDHRKIAVIDGIIAYTGGVNLADEYINKKQPFGHWKDTAVRSTGEAVWSFTVMFFELWNIASMDPKRSQKLQANSDIYVDEVLKYKADIKADDHNSGFESSPESGFILPFSDTPIDDEYISESAFLDMINSATRYIYISTPYLVIDNEMLKTLIFAAKRGVDVRILTPCIQDKPYMQTLGRAFYKTLIKGGVRIFEYTPGFNHAKILVADDRVAEVGSVNFDFRSLYLHFECAAILFLCPAIIKIKQDMLETFAVSEEITLLHLKNYPVEKRITGSILKLFAPLL
jgi:cardiolipin synthase